jgi:hypothetical protein
MKKDYNLKIRTVVINLGGIFKKSFPSQFAPILQAMVYWPQIESFFFFVFCHFFFIKLVWQKAIHSPMHLIQLIKNIEIKLQPLQNIHARV